MLCTSKNYVFLIYYMSKASLIIIDLTYQSTVEDKYPHFYLDYKDQI